MKKAAFMFGALASGATLLLACSARTPAPDRPGARVAIAVAPLDLPGIGDATYTVTVRNGGDEVVWTREVTSSAYGDGSGAFSYVGPCDADLASNTVTIELTHLYASGGAERFDFDNPGPLSRVAVCRADTDTPVTFDITLVREANQGFFDVAVSFADIFCSAKLDCIDQFLYNAAGERDQTVIVALACTTGAGTATILHLDNLEVDCSDGTQTQIVPTAGPGNTGQTGAHVFQVATYRGAEQLAPYQKCYWNTAIGLDMASFAGDTTTDCTLRTRASASEIGWLDGQTPEDATWPYIQWEVPLVTDGALVCSQHQVNVPGSGVTTEYAVPGGARVRFAAAMPCSTCVAGSCVASLQGKLCTGQLAGVADPVVFRETPEGVVVAIGSAESAATPLPDGYTLEGCCADPCCAN
ncbi:MAG: hypothetical protein EP329_13700 [Deltaproteobacteria bacterium]|nr:MAG: hypothetical protein EP329_13700 [Deltaproteobacteria bacterium]